MSGCQLCHKTACLLCYCVNCCVCVSYHVQKGKHVVDDALMKLGVLSTSMVIFQYEQPQTVKQ